MLDHPWMQEFQNKRVNMTRYLAQVWGWDEQLSEADAKSPGGGI
jgi:mitogen-activated protein kinase kinase